MASVCKFLTKKLRLQVNESKSAVARPDERKFLGFRLTTAAEPQRLISSEALQRFQARVRELTSRTRGISIERMIGSLKPYLLGWRSYFGFSQDPMVLRTLDARIRRRLRMVIWRQWGNGPDPITSTYGDWGCLTCEPPWLLAPRLACGRCRDTRLFSKRCPMPISTRSAFPECRPLRTLNSFKPPWYGTRMPGGVTGKSPRGPTYVDQWEAVPPG